MRLHQIPVCLSVCLCLFSLRILMWRMTPRIETSSPKNTWICLFFVKYTNAAGKGCWIVILAYWLASEHHQEALEAVVLQNDNIIITYTLYSMSVHSYLISKCVQELTFIKHRKLKYIILMLHSKLHVFWCGYVLCVHVRVCSHYNLGNQTFKMTLNPSFIPHQTVAV